MMARFGAAAKTGYLQMCPIGPHQIEKHAGSIFEGFVVAEVVDHEDVTEGVFHIGRRPVLKEESSLGSFGKICVEVM